MYILWNHLKKKEREDRGLLCPWVEDPAVSHLHWHDGKLKRPSYKEVERIGPYLIRYRCNYCKFTFKYDRTPLFRFGGDLKKYKVYR